ncbi:MAG: glycosyltransferase family 1 protein [Xanthobacteraceae bacterium]|nr:glycosyltransferase family 1 protein [Xanthobacteraceae bacterium]
MRLLYVVTEDWYFLSHRLPMARAAREAGFEVHVATRVVDGAAAIRAEGFTLHPVSFMRGRLSPLGTLATIRALRRVHRAVAPAIAHHVSLQCAVLGSIAAWGRPVSGVNALTGLGYTFTSGNAKALLLRPVLSALLRLLLNRPEKTVLVQNSDDRAGVLSLGIVPERIALIAGSGVDIEALQPHPEPQGPPTVAFVGRLLADKGIHTLIQAQRLLRQRGSNVELLIAGTPDPANPASVSEQDAAGFGREPGITWLGHVDDISALWARAHIAVLPSRREGLPKSLLEAAACGRPMIATDVPGCREVVRPGETGLLVPFDDAAALATAIETLAASPSLRASYGAAARRLAVERFSATAIGRQTVDLYRRLVGEPA